MAALYVTFVFLFFLSLGSCAPLTCPNLEDLSPCSCKRVAYGLHVICANFNSSQKLLRAFRILRDYRVHTVLLHGINVDDTLPSDLFDGMQIKEIRVENSRLRFSQPAFTGLDASLFVLNVAKHSMIRSKYGFTLAKLTKLNELNIQMNSFEKVENKWLNGKVPNVLTIVLDHNEIAELESGAFANLPLLQTISLFDNRVKSVERSMFPQPALHLRRIDLSSNEIRTLPKDFFSGMPNLKEVILSGNELETLHEATWTPVWEHLSLLLLMENQFICNQELHWIRKYRRPYAFKGNCVAPKNMVGKGLTDIYDT